MNKEFKLNFKNMDGIPKIKKIKNSIVNLPNVNDSIKNIIKFADLEANENEDTKEFIIFYIKNIKNISII